MEVLEGECESDGYLGKYEVEWEEQKTELWEGGLQWKVCSVAVQCRDYGALEVF